jgi:predicted peptidase
MASTFSPLKFELIGTGEQDGTWGDTTNTNIGTAIEQAITGSGDITFASSDVTLTLSNTNASQVARNLRLVCVGVSGGARQLIVPSIEKQYIVQNDLTDAVTIRTSAGTGVAVPAGKTTVVFNNGTDVVEEITNLNSLAVANLAATTLTATTLTATNLSATNVTVSSFSTANFSISQSGTSLVFKYNGSTIAQISSDGTITAAP